MFVVKGTQNNHKVSREASIKALLFRLARSRYAPYFIRFAFEYFTPLMPIRRIYEDRYVIAFPHPVPFWRTHWLIVPKRAIASFTAVDFTDPESAFRIVHILHIAQVLVRKHYLSDNRILVNGGTYQDVPQLHFHVASGTRTDGVPVAKETNVEAPDDTHLRVEGNAAAGYHPAPTRAYHRLLFALDDTPPMPEMDFHKPQHRSTLSALLQLAQELIHDESLNRYTLLATGQKRKGAAETLQLHLLSGAELSHGTGKFG